MSLTWPWALLGLLAIPVLVWLDRRRRRPRATPWPSLLLWRGVAEAQAPTKRRVEPLLLLECAAAGLLSVAAAGPALTARTTSPIVGVLDTGEWMHAKRSDGRSALEATRAELERIPGIEIVGAGSDLLAVATALRADGKRVAIGTSRADVQPGPGTVVVGLAPQGDNLAIDAVLPRGAGLWFAVATDGKRRNVAVQVGDRTVTVRTGTAVTTPFAGTIRILDEDNLAVDNVVRLDRTPVGIRYDRGLKALHAAVRAGLPARYDESGPLVISTEGGEVVAGPVRGADCTVEAGFFEGLLLDEIVWQRVKAHDGPGILSWRNKALARMASPAALWIGLPLDRDWGDASTLAVLVDRFKRFGLERRYQKTPGFRQVVGDAVVLGRPVGLVRTKGIDRPWDGSMPAGEGRAARERSLRWVLAAAGMVVLVLYLRRLAR